jgi:SAM-dependent methyltransferase
MNSSLVQDDAVRRHFQAVSSAWGSRYENPPRKMSDLDLLLRRESVHHFLRPIVEGGADRIRILDLGCGSGDVLDGLPIGASCIVNLDIVPEMVSAAAARKPGGHFAVADAANIPLAEARLDVVTCLGVLEYVPDPARVLRAIHEVLRPGGHLVVSFPNKKSWFRTLSKLESWMERTALSFRDTLRPDRPERTRRPGYRHAQWSVGEARRLLKGCGFDVLDVRFNTFGPWGRSGRTQTVLRFSAWMSRRFAAESWVSTHLGCTMVFFARRGEP